ncbi:MAG: DNA polymerase III subunit delta, partial [Paramuribaculum sp.]|nr:DNA polymerase III subunit delta [Paramuribaculum sp.]
MFFRDIPSHDSIKTRLRSMADSGRIPHAILIEGPSGIGKLSLARAFAKYVHCTGKASGDTDSCGRCPSCIQHQSLGHIDTHYVFPVVNNGKATKPISDDYMPEWKEYLATHTYMDFNRWVEMLSKKNAQPVIYVSESAALIHKLSFAAHTSRYKIVILWLPERMEIEAANKLLKMVEEPWDDTIFVMVSDSPGDILPTIYSRVQRIQAKKLSDSIIAELLEKENGVDAADALAIAHTADGSITTALKNLGSRGEESEFFDLFVSLMRLAYQRKVAELREWSATLSGLGRDKEMKFYCYAIRLMRENFIYNFKLPQLNYLSSTEAKFSTNFARFINERNVEKLV